MQKLLEVYNALNMLSLLLGWLFVLSQLAALFTLAWRGWWQRAPAFLVMLSLNCLQALSGAVGKPHNMTWWRYTWTPVEYLTVLASVAAVAECLWWRTRSLDASERFSCRFAPAMIAIGCTGLVWDVRRNDWYGWLVYAREYIWAGLALSLGWLVLFLLARPLRGEPRAPRVHCYTLAALLVAHALMAPLARRGFDRESVQRCFLAVMIACCAAWVMFGADSESDASQNPEGHPSSPYPASGSPPRPPV